MYSPPQPPQAPRTLFQFELQPKVGPHWNPTEESHASRSLPSWWYSDSPLSSPPFSPHSPIPTPSPTIPSPSCKHTDLTTPLAPSKKDNFEHPPESVNTSFYFPHTNPAFAAMLPNVDRSAYERSPEMQERVNARDEDDLTEDDTEDDTEEDTEDDMEHDLTEESQIAQAILASIVTRSSPPSSSSGSSLSSASSSPSPPTSPPPNIPEPKKKKEKKNPQSVKSQPKATTGGRIKKGEATKIVQCDGVTKRNAGCGFKKTVRVGEKWNCGRHE